jgi:hypothetical protein
MLERRSAATSGASVSKDTNFCPFSQWSTCLPSTTIRESLNQDTRGTPVPFIGPKPGQNTIDGVAFNGEGKLVPEGNWLRPEKAEAALSRIGFAGREPSFRPPLERIDHQQISPTKAI